MAKNSIQLEQQKRKSDGRQRSAYLNKKISIRRSQIARRTISSYEIRKIIRFTKVQSLKSKNTILVLYDTKQEANKGF